MRRDSDITVSCALFIFNHCVVDKSGYELLRNGRNIFYQGISAGMWLCREFVFRAVAMLHGTARNQILWLRQG